MRTATRFVSLAKARMGLEHWARALTWIKRQSPERAYLPWMNRSWGPVRHPWMMVVAQPSAHRIRTWAMQYPCVHQVQVWTNLPWEAVEL